MSVSDVSIPPLPVAHQDDAAQQDAAQQDAADSCSDTSASELRQVNPHQTHLKLIVKAPSAKGAKPIAQSSADPLDARQNLATDPPADLLTMSTKLEPPHDQAATTRGVSLEALQDRSIEAVVSLLDEEASKHVRAIWAGLEDEFGLQKIYAAPFPHFSYHSAERYDDDILTRLAEIAADLPPFTARVSGLGVFAAPSPIVYLAMVRNTVLSHHHELLWSKLVGHAYTSNLHYHPEAWVPHITLAQGDVTSESLPAVMTYLSDMTFDWDIHIDNLALVFADGLEQGIKQEFALSKPVDAAPNES